jgi:hypothetical protein
MLNEMEKRALEMLLAGADDRLAILRAQLNSATLDRREMSGVGFFTHLSIPPDVPLLVPGPRRMVIGDVYAEVTGLQHPAGFLLFVDDGALNFLECFIVDDRWPETATLRRPYYVHPATPGNASLVEIAERDVAWALRDAV